MGGVVEKTVLLLLLTFQRTVKKSYNHGRIIYFEHEAGDAIMHA
jgi:hypothetical protein